MTFVHDGNADLHVTYRVIVLEDVSFVLTDSSPAMHFREPEAGRTFSIPVATTDAQALATLLAGGQSRRPTSSDITALVLREVGADVIAVRIVRFEGGVFYAELDVMTHVGRRVFDTRPSDAIAIALRHPSPVPFLIDEEILVRVGRTP